MMGNQSELSGRWFCSPDVHTAVEKPRVSGDDLAIQLFRKSKRDFSLAYPGWPNEQDERWITGWHFQNVSRSAWRPVCLQWKSHRSANDQFHDQRHNARRQPAYASACEE